MKRLVLIFAAISLCGCSDVDSLIREDQSKIKIPQMSIHRTIGLDGKQVKFDLTYTPKGHTVRAGTAVSITDAPGVYFQASGDL